MERDKRKEEEEERRVAQEREARIAREANRIRNAREAALRQKRNMAAQAIAAVRPKAPYKFPDELLFLLDCEPSGESLLFFEYYNFHTASIDKQMDILYKFAEGIESHPSTSQTIESMRNRDDIDGTGHEWFVNTTLSRLNNICLKAEVLHPSELSKFRAAYKALVDRYYRNFTSKHSGAISQDKHLAAQDKKRQAEERERAAQEAERKRNEAEKNERIRLEKQRQQDSISREEQLQRREAANARQRARLEYERRQAKMAQEKKKQDREAFLQMCRDDRALRSSYAASVERDTYSLADQARDQFLIGRMVYYDACYMGANL